VLFAIFYFLVIRPQQKQQKAHAAMLAALDKGDKIITNGGLICEVIKAENDFIKVKLNDDVIVLFWLSASIIDFADVDFADVNVTVVNVVVDD